ncbi:MAG TPA: nitroreductase family deazaflavin-dependent oxidoreductase [Anaerolineales bacterium]|nr:nitroreductase family deazaflavin-dependent oxidoreductase [Anaerolineales bacterium]
MTGNDFVKFFLRTPLRIFMGDTMLITVKGRRTGKEYTTPVGYFQESDNLWVLSSRDRTWWRNVKDGADVKLLLKGKSTSAFAEIVAEEDEVEKLLADYVKHIPISAHGLGIRLEHDVPNKDDVARAAIDRLFVKISCSSA